VHHHALARIVQPFGRDVNAGLGGLLDEPAGRGHHLLDVGHHGRVRLIGTPHDQHVLRHHGLLIPRGRLSTRALPRRTSGRRIDTTPGEISPATQPIPFNPRLARQTGPLRDG